MYLVDFQAEDSPIEEIIEIPDKYDQNLKLIKYELGEPLQLSSAASPFQDSLAKFKKSFRDKKVSDRDIGISNYFKAQFKLDLTDIELRLKRKHRHMKRCWYNNVQTADNIE